jgi:RND superfamily putative drug exporter
VPGVTFVRDQGTSPDGQARKALVATSYIPSVGQDVVTAIRHTFTTVHAPAGLSIHLTGSLAQAVDANAASSSSSGNIQKFTVLFVIVLLFLAFRAALAPLAALLPAVASLLLAGPLIAEASKAGLPVSSISQQLPVVLVGAGTDYGLFLVFRTREELRRGAPSREAVVRAMGRVGPAITFSAATVVAALLSLLLATFGIYRGIGPSLAIGLAIMLVAALTLLPALLAIAGHALFWPSHPAPGRADHGPVGPRGVPGRAAATAHAARRHRPLRRAVQRPHRLQHRWIRQQCHHARQRLCGRRSGAGRPLPHHQHKSRQPAAAFRGADLGAPHRRGPRPGAAYECPCAQ